MGAWDVTGPVAFIWASSYDEPKTPFLLLLPFQQHLAEMAIRNSNSNSNLQQGIGPEMMIK